LICVVVYAQKPDYPAQLLAGALSRYGRVELHLSSSLTASGDGEAEYRVEAVSRLEKLMLPGSVLMAADRTAPHRLELDDGVIVVTGAENRRIHRLLRGRANPLITCGTGLRDTLTLSSTDGQRALLCAQRQLPTVTGEWLEPFEFSVQLYRCSMRWALLAAGAAAVCGCDLSRGDMMLGGESEKQTLTAP